ncbi:MAG: SprT-like domain-containing protein [Bacteroidota bacterium]|nr:SprT-like domain-containing protein [Bacteroidota bacterium]
MVKKYKLFFCFTLIYFSGVSQNVQLVYNGTKKEILDAVAEANKLLSNPAFYKSVNAIQTFDNTNYSGAKIVMEMNAIKTIHVTEYYKRFSKTNAKTQTEIRINTARLNRHLSSIVNTLIHETIHAVDWLSNSKWDYTHKSQKEEIPPISAPYMIGAIAEKMILP